MQSNKISQLFFTINLSLLVVNVFGQLSTPTGNTVSNSSGTGIGISNTSPVAQLDVNFLQNTNSGLIHLFARTQEVGVMGGGTQVYSPQYAFRLDYQYLNNPISTVFQITSAGKLQVGDLSGFTLNTFSSFQGDLGIYSSLGKLRLDAAGKIEWEGSNPFQILRYNAVLPLMELSTEGTLTIRNTSTGPWEYGEGAVYGLKIENNSGEGHNYALEISTHKGKIFDITNSGHMHLGPGLNFDIPHYENYRLYVEDGIRTERVKVDISKDNGWAWPDYVFDEDYPLMSLADLRKYISLNRHLPEVPTSEMVSWDGVELAEFNALLLKKLEELTLYILNLENRIYELEN